MEIIVLIIVIQEGSEQTDREIYRETKKQRYTVGRWSDERCSATPILRRA